MRYIFFSFFFFFSHFAQTQIASLVHTTFYNYKFSNTANTGWPVVNSSNNYIINGYANMQYTSGSPNVYINDNTAIKGTELQAIAQNNSGYLYGIAFIDANKYNIVSYNVNNNYSSQIAAANVDFDGSTSIDDDPEAMGIDSFGKAWIVGYSVITGNNYLSYFTTTNTGTVSNIVTSPVTITCNLPLFQVKDLAFDVIGNMYVLVKDMSSAGNFYIYYIPASSLKTPLTTTTLAMQEKWKITDENGVGIKSDPKYYFWAGSSFNPYSSYECGGLFFDNEGALVVGVDKMNFSYSSTGMVVSTENYFYKYSYPGNLSQQVKNIVLYNYTQNKQSSPVSLLGDAATNYLPAFLPLSYGSISATLSSLNNLQVNWETEAEKYCDRFEVQASTDGLNFKTIGTAATKAVNGNSSEAINYNFSLVLAENTFAVTILPVLFVLICLIAGYKRKMVLFIMAFLFFVACRKDTPTVAKTFDKIFVRIAHIDKDGKIGYSKIIQAVKN